MNFVAIFDTTINTYRAVCFRYKKTVSDKPTKETQWQDRF
jgi:hypothetical protein